MNIDTADAFEILRHYGIHVATGNADQRGTSIVISGETDDVENRTITLRGGAHAIHRMVPLGDAGAEVLATHLHGEQHPGADEHARRMLEHLLLRCSTMFEESGIATFHLDVRLHDSSYWVANASMTAPTAVHLKKRLTAHAHDRKGTSYRPTGRQ
jgi:hypothetical protein